jgi:hypothetical protein
MTHLLKHLTLKLSHRRLKSMHTNNLLELLTAPTAVGSGDLLDANNNNQIKIWKHMT